MWPSIYIYITRHYVALYIYIYITRHYVWLYCNWPLISVLHCVNYFNNGPGRLWPWNPWMNSVVYWSHRMDIDGCDYIRLIIISLKWYVHDCQWLVSEPGYFYRRIEWEKRVWWGKEIFLGYKKVIFIQRLYSHKQC